MRRVPEAMAGVLPSAALGISRYSDSSAVALSLDQWLHSDGGAIGFKHIWLSLPFFRVRAVFYLLGWLGFIWAILRTSRRQDADGDLKHTRTRTLAWRPRSSSSSGSRSVLPALTGSCLWSRSGTARSSDFYNIAGHFVSGLATLALLLVWLQRQSPLKDVIAEQHLHDVGKLLFAFSTFWAYLWFSQYMLIWYANLPDETIYYIRRLHGFWQPLFVLNLVLNWVVPFFALLPRMNKQRVGILVRVSIVLLAGRWLDLYLMIMPPFSGGKPQSESGRSV